MTAWICSNCGIINVDKFGKDINSVIKQVKNKQQSIILEILPKFNSFRISPNETKLPQTHFGVILGPLEGIVFMFGVLVPKNGIVCIGSQNYNGEFCTQKHITVLW